MTRIAQTERDGTNSAFSNKSLKMDVCVMQSRPIQEPESSRKHPPLAMGVHVVWETSYGVFPSKSTYKEPEGKFHWEQTQHDCYQKPSLGLHYSLRVPYWSFRAWNSFRSTLHCSCTMSMCFCTISNCAGRGLYRSRLPSGGCIGSKAWMGESVVELPNT